MTENFYNYVAWKSAARKLKMKVVDKGPMAGTTGVKIFHAHSDDPTMGGIFYKGSGWNYGQITTEDSQ